MNKTVFSQTYEGAMHAVTNQWETKQHIHTNKNLPRTVFKNIAYKKRGKNINDVKKIKTKRSEMLVHSQLANINICFFPYKALLLLLH